MPFKSDKQRAFLWSQKPDVARQIAYKQQGGGVYSSGIYDDAAKWHNKKMAGIPQHVGFTDDPDFITETAATNPDDPYGGKYLNPDRKAPQGRYTDLATYYTPKDRAMGRGEKELARMQANNEALRKEAERRGFVDGVPKSAVQQLGDLDNINNQRLREKAKGMGFKFQEGGQVPGGKAPKKVTQKDRYGNQTTVEYEQDVKPLDITSLVDILFDKDISGGIDVPVPGIGDVNVGFAGVPPMDHPGEPMGTDTVPAWLTPGEFVVNREATQKYGPVIEQMNNEGRMMQQAQGMQEGGSVPMPGVLPMSPTQALLEQREGFRDDVYLDSLGKPTVGHGHLLPDVYKDKVGEKPFSKKQLDEMFGEDIQSAEAGAKRNAEKHGVKWKDLNRREKMALTSMAFQLGEEGQGKFENMWSALAAGDKATAGLEALDSAWAAQTPQRAKDVYDAFTPGLGFYDGGPVYAYRGIDTAQQDAFDIEDPNADLSGGWTPPTYGMNEISPMEQAILDQEAMGESAYQQRLAQQIAMADNMVAGGDGDDLGTATPPVPAMDAPMPTPPAAMAMPDESSGEIPEIAEQNWWDNVVDWTFDTSVADQRNAEFNVKAAENNQAAAEETLAELEARIEAGEPVNEHTLAGAQAAVEHQQGKVAEAKMAKGEIDYEGVVAAESALMAANAPGKEDDQATLEELAESPEFEEEDDPSKPSEKGQQSEEEVIAQGEKAPPGMVEKAQGFFKGAFSDLFDGKELARMAIMYAGSRMLGYSHGGSLNWAAKQYVDRLDAKHTARDSFIQKNADNYTTASLQKYKETGDLSVLEAKGKAPITTGTTMQRTVGGKKVSFQQVKSADGSIGYLNPATGQVMSAAHLENNTQPYEAAFEKGTPEYRARRSRATGDAAGRFEEVWKAEDRFRVGDNEWKTTTDIRPKQAADEFWSFMEEHGIDPESDEALGIMTNAYHQAIMDGKANPKMRARSLKPYLQGEYIREKTGSNELFISNPDRKEGEPIHYVRGDKMAVLNRNVEYIAPQMPSLQGLAPQDAASRFYDAAIQDWGNLPVDKQKLFRDSAGEGESGFYYWLENVKIPKLQSKLNGA